MRVLIIPSVSARGKTVYSIFDLEHDLCTNGESIDQAIDMLIAAMNLMKTEDKKIGLDFDDRSCSPPDMLKLYSTARTHVPTSQRLRALAAKRAMRIRISQLEHN